MGITCKSKSSSPMSIWSLLKPLLLRGKKSGDWCPFMISIYLMIIQLSEIKKKNHSHVSLLMIYFVDVSAFGFSSSVGVCKLLS